jgi:hypothetical protein
MPLSPLEPHSESRRGAGNSSRNEGRGEEACRRYTDGILVVIHTMRRCETSPKRVRSGGHRGLGAVVKNREWLSTSYSTGTPAVTAASRGRAWARQLGISHTWLQKLVKRFTANPSEMQRLKAAGDPRSADLIRAKESSQEMRARGELRPYRNTRSNRF